MIRTIDKKLRSILSAGENCNRIPVTTEWLYEHPEITGYLYKYENDVLGLDPWITLDGVDRSADLSDNFWLDYGVSGSIEVKSEFIVFIQKPKDFME